MREIPYDRAAAVAYARKWALSRKILPFTKPDEIWAEDSERISTYKDNSCTKNIVLEVLELK